MGSCPDGLSLLRPTQPTSPRNCVPLLVSWSSWGTNYPFALWPVIWGNIRRSPAGPQHGVQCTSVELFPLPTSWQLGSPLLSPKANISRKLCPQHMCPPWSTVFVCYVQFQNRVRHTAGPRQMEVGGVLGQWDPCRQVLVSWSRLLVTAQLVDPGCRVGGWLPLMPEEGIFRKGYGLSLYPASLLVLRAGRKRSPHPTTYKEILKHF